MTFAQPLWIIAGFIVCLGTLFLLRILQSQRQATLEKFASAHLLERLTRNVSAKRQLTKKILFLLALFCCFLALARPQYGFRWEDTKRKGIDILFAVDTSKSMLVEDIKPNRLERAKFAIIDFVDQLQGDRVGLLPFAGTAFLMCPLTGDYSAFETSLNAVDTTIIPKGGTNITAAIREAQAVLTNEANYKILILITDGENLEGDALAAATEAAQKGLRIFTVGVGTREGEIIPISPEGAAGFVKDASGNFVVSHLDEATLTQIAEKTDGLYAPLGNKGQGLETIYQKKLALVPKEELTERRNKVPLERFGWPLTAAIGILALEFMIGTRKSNPFRLPFLQNSGHEKKIGSLLMLAMLLCLLSLPVPSTASEKETATDSSDSPKTLEVYNRLLKKHPDDPRIQFNAGTAFYKNKKFDEAVSAFNGALKSKDLDLQEMAYYNRGNAYYKKGAETTTTDPQQTLEQWQHAVESYAASLELKPDDSDASYNRNLVQKKIDELKKQEENRKKQDQQKKNENKDNKKEEKNQNNQQEQNTKDAGSQQQQQPSPEQNGQEKDRQNQNGSVTSEKDKQQKQASLADKESDGTQTEAANSNERRKQGKMTKEDAEQLLNSLKNEEGKLNFLPTGEKNKDDAPRRDW
jgi:Ca-activated chloride channel family protein